MRGPRRARLLLVLLLLTAVTLVTLDVRAGRAGPLAGLRSAAGDTFGPVERALSGAFRPVGGFFAGLGHLGGYKDEYDAEARQVAQLQAQLRMTERVRAQAQHYAELFGLASRGQYRIVAARPVAFSGGIDTESTVTIDAGSRDGVRVGEAVVTGSGLVGKVIRVSSSTSLVVLLVDPSLKVGVRVASTSAIGDVQGQGLGKPLRLRLFDLRATIKVGDQLVTLGGTGETYVPEVPVGTVTAIEQVPGGLYKAALVNPYVDFGGLDILGVVIANPTPPKRGAVLPPPPAASARPTPARGASPTPSGRPSP